MPEFCSLCAIVKNSKPVAWLCPNLRSFSPSSKSLSRATQPFHAGSLAWNEFRKLMPSSSPKNTTELQVALGKGIEKVSEQTMLPCL